MMAKAGKIIRAHEALRIELEARPGEYFVIGASDAKTLIDRGATVPLYQIVRSDDVDIVQEVGTAYGTKTGKGLAINITTGMPVLPTLYASKAQVEDVYRGFRTAAMVSAPADLSPQPEARRPSPAPVIVV
jgi:hypothetical protein